LFNSEYYNAQLSTRWLSKKYQVLDEVDSTNSYLKLKNDQPIDGFLVLAESQVQGRGQSNRIWKSDPGQNLTFSFYFRPLSPKRLHSLTIVIAHSCAKVLSSYTQKQVHIKWPNDLISDGQKVGGILVESELKGNVVEKLIIGIGINVNQTDFDAEIPNATSLKRLMSSNADIPREDVLSNLCSNLETDLELWNSNMPLDRAAIHSKLVGYGEVGSLEVNGILIPDHTKFVGICTQGFPTFVSPTGEISKYRHEQIRFYPENKTHIYSNTGRP
jgi:BirA family biotin operon repressor/biotin-[acetyl-CoA-carboxylase] ligase